MENTRRIEKIVERLRWFIGAVSLIAAVRQFSQGKKIKATANLFYVAYTVLLTLSYHREGRV